MRVNRDNVVEKLISGIGAQYTNHQLLITPKAEIGVGFIISNGLV